MKVYRVRNLYFQFIKNTALDGKLSAENAALCLSDHGLIELLPDRFLPERPLDFYRWLKAERESQATFTAKVYEALKQCEKNGRASKCTHKQRRK